MSDIFISYSSSDRSKALLLASALEREGCSVWWDRKIRPGQSFDEVIDAELERAKCIIVLWSKDSVISKWVKAEAAEGNNRGILIPASIEDHIRIPLEFRRLHTSRLTDWAGQANHPEFDAILGAVLALLGNALSNAPAQTVSQPEFSRAAIPAQTAAVFSTTTHEDDVSQQLLSHPVVVRLLRNPQWEPAARAAIAYFAQGVNCSIQSWRRSSTWQQVAAAFDEITKRN